MRRFLRFLLKLVLAAGLLAAGFQLFHAASDYYTDLTFYNRPHTEAEYAVMAYAQENGYAFSDYPSELIDLLDRNPETETYVLEYPAMHDREQTIDLSAYRDSDTVPLFLQWDQRWGYLRYGDGLAGLTACGPVCLSMAAFYLTGDDAYSPDRMIEYAGSHGYYSWGNGSSWTLISEGAVDLGFDVTELPLDENRIAKNLEAGNPVICVVGPGDFTTTGHFIVFTGTENGKLRVNDPNSIANSQKLWDYDAIKDQIRNLWAIRYFE